MTQASGGHGEKRSRREEAAIAALLACPTLETAAEQAGVAGSTLRGWLRDPEFQRRYREARRQVVEQAITSLQQAAGDAVEALRRNLTCGTPAAEIAAAKAIIDQAVKGVELVDLAERVEQLEQAAAQAADPGGRQEP
jgi:hypothetical protein